MHIFARSSQLFVGILAIACAAACATFDAPPEPRLVGDTDGLLSNADSPIVVAFSKPIDPRTLRLKIVSYVTDIEGNLADEDADPKTTLDSFYQHDEHGDVGGTGTLDGSNKILRIHLLAPLPIGPRLAILVEPGLADPAGDATTVRRRLIFGYSFDLKCGEPAKSLPPFANYFMVADVVAPIATQVQLFASIRIDPETGNAIGQFTNADRNPDGSRCSPACSSDEACRTVPQQECVLPSDRAGSVDEFVDFVPNTSQSTGFSFTANACLHDQTPTSGVFVIAPVDVTARTPPVTLRNVHLIAAFTNVAGVLRATGSFSSDAVLLGTTPSGAAEGALSARILAPDQTPPGIPEPPPLPTFADAGTSSSSSSSSTSSTP